MKIFDTLSGKKKLFVPRKKNRVDIFVCGPTVYDHAHIGHARTYIAMDAFVKYLRMKKFDVTYVQNITDIDDKIIARAQERGAKPQTLARDFEKEYLKDMRMLSVNSVTRYARATDFVPQIIKQIQTLIKKGYAYETQTGVYFEVKKFRDYGKLSRQSLTKLQKAARTQPDETKKNPEDFALWKKPEPFDALRHPSAPFGAAQGKRLRASGSGQAAQGRPFDAAQGRPGEPTWQSPWGDGRPGWHIEDTAITETLFGPQYDIHGGARDLIFPHHESEIAQMEASSGKKPMVNYWMHTGFLTVGKEKMSKSLGNFITIQDFLEKYGNAYDFRLFILTKHYRSPIVFDEKEIAAYKTERVMGIQAFLTRLNGASGLKKHREDFGKLEKNFWAALDDDFNTPEAFGILFKLISQANTWIAQGTLDKDLAVKIKKFFVELDTIFGIIDWDGLEHSAIPQKIKILVEKREQLRKEKKWREADMAREEILKLGYEIEDTPEGPRIYKKEI